MDMYLRSMLKKKTENGSCLSEKQLVTLAEFGLRLEEHYKYPQDVEWAVDSRGTHRYPPNASPSIRDKKKQR